MDKFAIFDLDGTLLDTIEDLADSCNYALQKQGFPVHPVNPYKYFVGSGVVNLIKSALPENSRDPDTIMRVKKDYDEYYSTHSTDKTKPYPGIRDAVERLKAAGVKLAVLSNKPHVYTCKLAEIYFPGLFDLAFGQRDGVPRKPDPEAVFEIIRLLGMEAGKGFYIGDTSVDIETGKNAGLTTMGVLWGFRTRDELENSGADVIIDKSEDLHRIIIDNNA